MRGWQALKVWIQDQTKKHIPVPGPIIAEDGLMQQKVEDKQVCESTKHFMKFTDMAG